MGTSDLETRDDGSFVVEAPTAEAALEAVRDEFGPEASIVDAELVQSKGIAGFFSKQLYRVRVTAPDVTHPVAGPEIAALADSDVGKPAGSVSREAERLEPMSLMAPPTEPVDQAVDVVLRQVEAGEDTGTRSFGEALHAELAARGVRAARDAEISSGDPRLREMMVQRDRVISGTVDVRDGVGQHRTATPHLRGRERAEPSVPAPAALFTLGLRRPSQQGDHVDDRVPLGRPVGEWAPGAGPVLWSLERLSALGLDPHTVAEFRDIDPADDLGWVYRLSEALTPLCGAMPEEALLLVGRDVEAASSQMGIEVVSYPEPPVYDSDAAISIGPDGPSAMTYVGRVQAGRPLHVVCDGTGWIDGLLRHDQVGAAVRVVSATRRGLAEALRTVVVTRGVLGYFLDQDALVRITPFELAIGVRSLLPRS